MEEESLDILSFCGKIKYNFASALFRWVQHDMNSLIDLDFKNCLNDDVADEFVLFPLFEAEEYTALAKILNTSELSEYIYMFMKRHGEKYKKEMARVFSPLSDEFLREEVNPKEKERYFSLMNTNK